MILLESKVCSGSLLPAIVLRWGEQAWTLDPAQAREHALNILRCTESAEHDSALVRWMMRAMEVPESTAVGALGEIREMRGMEELETPQ